MKNSILGPLLFNIFLNDLLLHTNQRWIVSNYANDNKLDSCGRSTADIIKNLESDLKIVLEQSNNDWTRKISVYVAWGTQAFKRDHFKTPKICRKETDSLNIINRSMTVVWAKYRNIYVYMWWSFHFSDGIHRKYALQN